MQDKIDNIANFCTSYGKQTLKNHTVRLRHSDLAVWCRFFVYMVHLFCPTPEDQCPLLENFIHRVMNTLLVLDYT